MKLRLHKLSFLFLFFSFFICKVQAQLDVSGSDFLNGYIVTQEQDTIHGFLELFDEISSCQKVHFKESRADKNMSIYNAEDLLAYQRKDEVYVSYNDEYCLLKNCMNDEGHTVFIKLIDKDILSVYMYAKDRSDHFYTVNYIPVVQKEGFDPIPYKGNLHIRKMVSSYFSDYPELANKLREKEYKNQEFDLVVNDYTTWAKSSIE
ncbi:hypothetical protein [Chondrinema litorale]|uniref:hypothetical protein n=1 Tax=Chondrinema litorale TaxID=2994555 RepID=UPI00254305E0|nr:hypothetical protein [Chondrinema litorale]UZR94221.1 hypothetical protein OQ292_00080 [Chondrinema litorale]